MASFEERMGLVEPRSVMQTDSLDDHTRTHLWNFLFRVRETLHEKDPLLHVNYGGDLAEVVDDPCRSGENRQTFSGPYGPSPLEPKVSDVMKRLVVGVFVSAVAVVGIAPVASAATSSDTASSAVAKAKVKKPKAPKVIDWDAPAPVSGGYTTQRIDWD